MAYEILIAIFFVVAIIALLISGVVIVQPYEQGLWIVLGQYRKRLNPGFNWVYPLISEVIRMDLRTQVLDVPKQEVITKDNSPTNVDAIVYIRVIDPEKSYFEVTNYHVATVSLAQTTLRSVVGDMELDEILYNRDFINAKLRDILDHATDAWGVKVEAVEIREVDPIGRVKEAMEEQTSAERKRRAAILLADGKKKAAILEAEGSKQAMILNAEGVRQSKILEAEGERISRILRAQGDAQKLRILSLGASPLDKKALTVLSLEMMKEMGNGQATKIIFPMEISRMVDQVAKYLGASDKVPEVGEAVDVERIVGKAADILGPIPRPEELKTEIESIEKEMARETQESLKIAESVKDEMKKGKAEKKDKSDAPVA
ncbi:MAG TPA: SPFH/Band 7/PHB domain protein [Candidatus Methanoperedenaceae archaeon]|nr:SPFH/Band 7/PHB domain protein [Candidatus Methanoperedenaceae archaeon]